MKSATGNNADFDPSNSDIHFTGSDAEIGAYKWKKTIETAAGPMYRNRDITLFPADVAGASLWKN